MMRKFLKNSALFLTFAAVAICLLQAVISFRIKNKTVTGYDTWDTTSNINADLVLLGSSRCWAHFDPNFFEETYNLETVNIGMNGHSELTASILRLENYLAKNKAPKFAVLSFDPFTKPGNFKDNTNFTNKDNYARFAFMPTKENSDLVDYFKFDNYEKYIPLYALFKYQHVQDCITLQNSDIFKQGFELNDEKWDTIKHPITDNGMDLFFNPREIPNTTRKLKALDNLCTKNGIQLICIQTPVYKAVYDKSVFAQPWIICNELGIPFINLSNSHIKDKTDYFYNTMHLNKHGIQEMNKLLRNNKELTAFLK